MANELDNIFGNFNKVDDDLVAYKDSEVGLVRDWATTLIPSADSVMINGIPISDRVTEIYGQPSVGKSTYVANLIANMQKMGVMVVYFDTELTLNRERLVELGVDPAKLATIKPKVNKVTGAVSELSVEYIGDKIMEVSNKLHKQYPDTTQVFIWDTIANTQSEMEATKDLDQQTVGQQSHALSRVMRKLVPVLSANGASLIALNQARANIGEMNPYLAKQDKTVGGKAMEHADSLKLYLTKGSKIKKSSSEPEPIGHVVKVNFIKSKLGENTGAKSELALLDENGYDLYYNTLVDAKDLGIVSQGKSYVTDNGKNVGKRSFNAFLDFLREPENQDLFTEIWQKVLLSYFPDCYPVLFNTNAVMEETDFPIIRGLRDYYIKRQEALPEEKRNGTYNLWKMEKENEKHVKEVMKPTKKAGK